MVILINNHTMSESLPTNAIIAKEPLKTTDEQWFDYPVTVFPHHTDYSGAVWHGNYLTWMESARVECLNSIGVNYAELVKLGCEMPVVDLNLRYHRSVRMGMNILVRTRLSEMDGVRMYWEYQICSLDHQELYVSGRVTLVPVDFEKGKILRKLPSFVQSAIDKLAEKLV